MFNLFGKKGNSALLQAIAEDDKDSAESLISKVKDINESFTYKDPQSDTKRDGWNYTMVASRLGSVGVLKLLLAAGANVKATDDQGNSPLYWTSSTLVIEALIKANADVNHKAKNGRTPVFGAIIRGDVRCVLNFLEQEGINVNVESDGNTPLTAVLSSLLPSVEKEDAIGIIRNLLSLGADINLKVDGNSSQFHIVCMYGYSELVDLYLSNGANPNELDERGTPPLNLVMNAADSGYFAQNFKEGHESIELLVNAGADVNYEHPEDGSTAMHNVLAKGGLDSVKYLISKGYDLTKTSFNGVYSVLDYASHKDTEKRIEIMQFLYDNKCPSHEETDLSEIKTS